MHMQIGYVDACGIFGRIDLSFSIFYLHVFPYSPHFSLPPFLDHEVVASSSLLANEAAETSRTATGTGTSGDPPSY